MISQKNQVSKIVEAISNDSPLTVTEIFAECMLGLCRDKLQEVRRDIGSKLFTETLSGNLDGAVDFVMEDVAENGLGILEAAIEMASQQYEVPKRQIIEALQDELVPKVEYKPIQENFLEILSDIASHENYAGLVQFDNKTARLVEDREAQEILELWTNLNHTNREILESNIVKDLQSFEKVLEFAESSFRSPK